MAQSLFMAAVLMATYYIAMPHLGGAYEEGSDGAARVCRCTDLGALVVSLMRLEGL